MTDNPDFGDIVGEVLRDHGKLRHIVSLLYNEDMAVRLRAALAPERSPGTIRSS